MADSKRPRASKPAAEADEQEIKVTDAVPSVSTALAEAAAAAPTAVPTGGFTPDFQPSGLFTSSLGLDADVTPGLTKLAPTFGEVLLAIGQGVAASQEALDKSLVDTAKELSETKIKVVTDVIQKINDDGLPDADETELITENVALINFMNPAVHEWKNVAVSMDFEVGAMDSERGVQFKQSQGSSSSTGGFWGFGGWFNYEGQHSQSNVTQRDRTEANWATGQVRMDATLAPRRTEKFTAPSQVAIGPQVYFSQGAVQRTIDGGKETERSIDVTISVLKADGSVNPAKPLTVECDRFGFSFASDPLSEADGFRGSTTNSQGKVKVTLSRPIPNERFSAPTKATLKVRLGAVSRTLEIVL